jgi:predicted metal-dependent hydrolase
MKIVDQVVRSKRKSLSIQIKDDGQVIVRAPLRMSENMIHGAVEKHRSWIISRRDRIKQQLQENPPKEFIDGEYYHYLGQQYQLKFVTGMLTGRVILRDSIETAPAVPENVCTSIRKWYIEQAQAYIAQRLDTMSTAFDIQFNQMKITSAARRWGSCSSRKVLSFSWRLIMCPSEIVDYVIIHEMAHLLELNHSPRFWAVVEAMCPDYRIRQKWLKHNSSKFQIF